MGWLRKRDGDIYDMSRTINYDTPASDAIYLEGTITSPSITQETPVTFRVPMVRTNGVNDIDATVARLNVMEDLIDREIELDPSLARVPMDPPVIG